MLQDSFLTKHLSKQDLQLLAGAMQQRSYKDGELVIKYGDVGNEYFIFDKGLMDIIVYKEGTSPKDPELVQKIAF